MESWNHRAGVVIEIIKSYTLILQETYCRKEVIGVPKVTHLDPCQPNPCPFYCTMYFLVTGFLGRRARIDVYKCRTRIIERKAIKVRESIKRNEGKNQVRSKSYWFKDKLQLELETLKT